MQDINAQFMGKLRRSKMNKKLILGAVATALAFSSSMAFAVGGTKYL